MLTFNELDSIVFNSTESHGTKAWGSGFTKLFESNRYNNPKEDDPEKKEPLFDYYIPTNDSILKKEGAFELAKSLFGCTVKISDGRDETFQKPRYNMNKPLIVLSDVFDAARPKTNLDYSGAEGYHWVVLVILPKNYNTPNGKPLNNSNVRCYLLDSLLTVKDVPDLLKKAFGKVPLVLKEEIEIEKKCYTKTRMVQSAGEEVEFIHKNTNQQEGGTDCGWWALYNGLMVCFTGGIGFLDKFKDGPVSAAPIRKLFPELLYDDRAPNTNPNNPSDFQDGQNDQADCSLSDGSSDEDDVSINTNSNLDHYSGGSNPSYPLTAGGLKFSMHGDIYQLVLLILAAHRAKQGSEKTSFIITEADEFEKFDDLVIDYGDRMTLLQAKHCDESSKQKGKKNYSKKDFCKDPHASDNDASLAKYFDSWYRLEQSKVREIEESNEKKDMRYIFFSNRGLGEDMKRYLIEVSGANNDEFLFEGLGAKTYQFKEKEPFLEAILDGSEEVERAQTNYKLLITKPRDLDDVVDKFVALFEGIESETIDLATKEFGCFKPILVALAEGTPIREKDGSYVARLSKDFIKGNSNDFIKDNIRGKILQHLSGEDEGAKQDQLRALSIKCYKSWFDGFKLQGAKGASVELSTNGNKFTLKKNKVAIAVVEIIEASNTVQFRCSDKGLNDYLYFLYGSESIDFLNRNFRENLNGNAASFLQKEIVPKFFGDPSKSVIGYFQEVKKKDMEDKFSQRRYELKIDKPDTEAFDAVINLFLESVRKQLKKIASETKGGGKKNQQKDRELKLTKVSFYGKDQNTRFLLLAIADEDSLKQRKKSKQYTVKLSKAFVDNDSGQLNGVAGQVRKKLDDFFQEKKLDETTFKKALGDILIECNKDCFSTPKSSFPKAIEMEILGDNTFRFGMPRSGNQDQSEQSKKKKKDAPTATVKYFPKENKVEFSLGNKAVNLFLYCLYGGESISFNAEKELEKDLSGWAKEFFEKTICNEFFNKKTGYYKEAEKKFGSAAIERVIDSEKRGTVEKSVNRFLDSLVLKLDQPDTYELEHVVMRELKLSANLARSEIYHGLYRQMLELLGSRYKCVMGSGRFGVMFEQLKSNVNRFFMLGGSKAFYDGYDNAFVSESLKSFYNDSLYQFLNPFSDSSASLNPEMVAVVAGSSIEAQRLHIRLIVNQFEEQHQLAQDKWAYVPLSSDFLEILPGIIEGRQWQFVVIDCGASEISAEKFEQLKEVCLSAKQSAQQGSLGTGPIEKDLSAEEYGTKVVLLCSASNCEALQAGLGDKVTDSETGGGKKEQSKIKTIDIGPLSDEKIEEICKSYKGQYIPFAGKGFQLQSPVKDHLPVGLYEVMHDLGYLHDIFRLVTNKEPVYTPPESLPYGIYKNNDLTPGIPCYDLRAIIRRKSADVLDISAIDADLMESFIGQLGGWVNAKSEDGKEVVSLAFSSNDVKKGTTTVVFRRKETVQGCNDALSKHPGIMIICTGGLEGDKSDLQCDKRYAAIQILDERESIFSVIGVPPFYRSVDFPTPLGYYFLESSTEKFRREDLFHHSDEKNQTAIRLLAADAGHGKTSLCDKQLLDWKGGQDRNDVMLCVSLPNVQYNKNDDTTFKALLGATRPARDWHEWERLALEKEMHGKNGQLHLLLDSVDEVKDENFLSALNDWIKKLPQQVALLVTTRPHAANKIALPQGRQLSAYLKLERYDDAMQKDYVGEFLRKYMKAYQVENKNDVALPENKKLIKKLAERTVNRLASVMEGRVRDLVGVPLEMYLFCMLLSARVTHWWFNMGGAESKEGFNLDDIALEDAKWSITKLYQQFALTKLQLFLEKHMKLNPFTTLALGDRVYALSNVYTEILMVSAFSQLHGLGFDYRDRVLRSKFFKREESLRELKDMGIVRVQMTSDSFRLVFNHETYKEYFAAIYMLKTILAGVESAQYNEVKGVFLEARYRKKFGIFMTMASEISVEGDPLIPGWDVLNPQIVGSFWHLLCSEPRDLLGVAKKDMFEVCLAGFSNAMWLRLRNHMADKDCAPWYDLDLKDFLGNSKKITDETSDVSKGSQKASSAVVPYLPSFDPNSDEDNSTVELDEKRLKNKDKISSYLKELYSANDKNSVRKSLSEKFTDEFLDNAVSSEGNFFWDVDGGFMALAELGDYFKERHANFIKERLKERVSRDQRLRTVPDVVVKLMELVPVGSGVYKCALDLAYNVFEYQRERGWILSSFVHDLAGHISTEDLVDGLFVRIRSVLHAWDKKEVPEINKMSFLALFDKNASDNRKVTALFRTVLEIAKEYKCAIISRKAGRFEVQFSENDSVLNVGKTYDAQFKEVIADFVQGKSKKEIVIANGRVAEELGIRRDKSLDDIATEMQSDKNAAYENALRICKALKRFRLFSPGLHQRVYAIYRGIKFCKDINIDKKISLLAYVGSAYIEEIGVRLIKWAEGRYDGESKWEYKKLVLECLKAIGESLQRLKGLDKDEADGAIKAYNKCVESQVVFGKGVLTAVSLESDEVQVEQKESDPEDTNKLASSSSSNGL